MAVFLKSKSAWSLVFISGLLPLAYIVYVSIWGDLGAEPAKALVEYLGETALIILFIVLSLTPARKVKALSGIVRFRRMIGLYVFFYAMLHLVAYGLLLVDWQNLIEDLYKRLYVTMGFAAFLILLALAVTSPKFMVRRLGRKWKSLHRLVYLALILVVVHVTWQVRSDYSEALMYGAIAVLLLAFRFPYFKSLARST